jgi:hypothetical protein
MTGQVVDRQVGERVVPIPARGWTHASLTRRLVAFVVDLIVLTAGFVAALALGVSLVDEGVLAWLVAAWIVVVAPLYFSLYHAYGGPERGPGWTPGQHELRICVRDERTGGRISVGRALARAYGGLLAAALVVPLFIDLVSLMASPDARAWHDRLSRSEVSNARALPLSTVATTPTVDAQRALFDVDGRPGTALFGRARRLLAANVRSLVGSTLLLYLGLLGIGAVLVPILVSDYAGTPDDVWLLATWLLVALALFASGIYWTQATLAVSVEAVRTGDRDVTLTELVRRAARRANALSVAVILLVGLLVLTPYTMFLVLLLVARFALVVPAIALDDETVFGAFGRSWRLTRRKTFSVLVRAVVTVGVLAVGFALAALAGIFLAWAVTPDEIGVSTLALSAIAGLALASVPLSALTALVGCAWCLLYYDLRPGAEDDGDG